jgi:AraC-like DNA-binding protein
MTRDTLSDVLRCVRLRGAVFYFVSCRDAWAAEAAPAREVAAAVMPGAEHVMEYHMVAKGQSWASLDCEPPVRLVQGDVVVFAHGDRHVMASAPGVAPVHAGVELAEAARGLPRPLPIAYVRGDVRAGERMRVADADAVLVCGFLGCDLRPFNPLVAALPRMLHLPAARQPRWVSTAIDQAVTESQQRRPGGDVLLERLSEMMFVDAARSYLETLPDQARGWLAGLRDRYVGRVLALIHAHPERAWTVEALAREAALSRSALHERFVHYVGEAPMHYLAQWRVQVGARLLRESMRTVATIAAEVGYESEAAFSRAFKRLVGAPPAAWRRAQAGRSAAGD